MEHGSAGATRCRCRSVNEERQAMQGLTVPSRPLYMYRDTAVFLLGSSDARSCEQAEAHVEHHHGSRVPAQAFSHALPLRLYYVVTSFRPGLRAV